MSGCAGEELATYLPTLQNIQDPLNAGTACAAANCEDPGCDYTFTGAPQADSYSIWFTLETGVANFEDPGCYELTENGIAIVE